MCILECIKWCERYDCIIKNLMTMLLGNNQCLLNDPKDVMYLFKYITAYLW